MSNKTVTTMQRRRGTSLETALLNATWKELQTAGYRQLTFDNVAKRAGTSKTVLYRRWPNRLELVRAALRTHRSLIAGVAPDTGSLRDDVVALLTQTADGIGEIKLDIIWGMLSDAISSDPQQHSSLQSQVRQANVAVMTAVLRQAEVRGELVLAAIPQRIITLPLDLARHEMFLTGRPATTVAIKQIVDKIFLPLLTSDSKIRS